MVARRYGLPVMPPRKDRGWTTGMGVMAFQNHQLAINHKRQWSDAELLAEMRAEFPLNVGRIFVADKMERHVRLRALRTLFNRGAHNNVAPAQLSVEYPTRPTNMHASRVSERPRSRQAR